MRGQISFEAAKNSVFIIVIRTPYESSFASFIFCTQVLVLSQNYSMDESGLGRGTGSRRQRMELLRWIQFARRAQLALADHVHEFDTGKSYRS